jgi:hypothetical protein
MENKCHIKVRFDDGSYDDIDAIIKKEDLVNMIANESEFSINTSEGVIYLNKRYLSMLIVKSV